MIPFRKSIGFRLFAISFILLAFPLLVDSFILVERRYEHAIGDAKSYLVEVAHLRELPLAHIRPLNEPMTSLIIEELNLETHFPKKRDEKLNQELKKIAEIGNFFGIFLVSITPEGRYIVMASGDENFIGRDYTDFFKLGKYFTESFVQRSGYETFISYDNQLKEPFFIASQTIYSAENKPIGLVAISYDVASRLKELLAPDIHNYQVNFALLLTSGIVFDATDPDLNFKYFIPLSPEYLALYRKENPIASHSLPDKPLPVKDTIGFPFFEFKWMGEEQIGYVQKMENVNFSLLAYASKKNIFRSPFLDFLNLYSVYGIILLVGGLIAWFLIKRMAKPIQSLSKVMIGIQKGDLSLRYKNDPVGFEINDLGNIFNQMIDKVLTQKHLAEVQRVSKETFAKELRLGQQVQRTLLPQVMPQYSGVEIAEVYIPAIEVGGDFYDVFIKKSNHHKQLVLACADASGKGVRACFYSLTIRNMLRIYAKEFDNIAKAMAMANNLFCKDTGETGMFVTAIMGVYDHYSRVFQYFSCGHNPPIVLKKDGTVRWLVHQSIALGVVTMELDVQPQSVLLEPEDILVLYTDGITEAHNNKNELYGEERLVECLNRAKDKEVREMATDIVQDVNQFVGEAAQHDDITLVVMKIVDM